MSLQPTQTQGEYAWHGRAVHKAMQPAVADGAYHAFIHVHLKQLVGAIGDNLAGNFFQARPVANPASQSCLHGAYTSSLTLLQSFPGQHELSVHASSCGLASKHHERSITVQQVTLLHFQSNFHMCRHTYDLAATVSCTVCPNCPAVRCELPQS